MRLKNFFIFLVLLVVSQVVHAIEPGKVPDKFGQTYADKAFIRFGDYQDVICGYDTAQTADSFVCGLSTDSEAFILMQKADVGTDMELADFGVPTLVIANSDPTKYLTISHDGTNAVIDSSTGIVTFPDGLDLGAGSMSFGASLIFEGATADAYETTLTVVDPASSDKTVTLPNQTGAVILSAGGVADTASAISGGTGTFIFEGATANGFETTVTTADPTADNTITLPDASGTVIVSGAAASLASVTATGSVLSTSATNIGWSVVSGANTACNTTCTNACVFGQNTADMSIVDCAAATADVCVCAGAN